MRRILCLLVMTLVLAGCAQQAVTIQEPEATMVEAPEPMVMVNGVLYYSTGEESTIDGRCGVMDGEITSTVGKEGTPNVNNQSNFGFGYGYQFVNGYTIEVYVDEQWIVFKSVEDIANQYAGSPWGIELRAEDVTAKGMTLVCHQAGGEWRGEQSTGSHYWWEQAV